MANMEEKLQAVVSQAESDSNKWHSIVHGNENMTIQTENGKVPTVAKQLKDIRDAITGGVSDVVAEAEAARDEAISAKNATNQLKSQTNTIKTETAQLKADTLSIKNQAVEVFNNISTSTDTAILNIQTEASSQISSIKNTGTSQISSINSTATNQISSINSTGTTQVNTIKSTGTTQVNNIKTEGSNQIALATEQANLSKYYAESCAPAPLGSRLSVPANKKVPDGYEPVWYKNTITRERYPDFFEQLVDTNYLVFTTEATYDSQVSSYGMCASYVKVDNNTVILPLLKNYARSGTTDEIGTVLNDQFQGHYHIAQIRQDAYGSGDGATIGTTSGTDEGLRQDSPDVAVLNPKTGAHGTARFGSETRPKSYYELVYIKCADISRPLSEENTTELRNIVSNKVDTNLGNITAATLFNKMGSYSKSSTSFWEKNNATGLIIQGGRVNITSDADFSVTFPKAFASALISVVITPFGQPTNATSDTNYCAAVMSASTTAFTIRYMDSDSTGRRRGNVSWLAVGY